MKLTVEDRTDNQFYKSLTETYFERAHFQLESQLQESFAGKIRLYIANDRAEFDKIIIEELENKYHQTPSPKNLYAVTIDNKVVFLNPEAYKKDGDIEFDKGRYYLLMKHQLFHIYHREKNRFYKNCPRFLVEGLPVYFSGQFSKQNEYQYPVEQGIKRGSIPNLLARNSPLVVQNFWGWSFVKYYYETHGLNKTKELIKDCKVNQEDIDDWRNKIGAKK